VAGRLRFGVLSTARIGVNQFIPAARVSELGEVVAIASRDGQKAAEVAQRLGIPRAHGSYEALLTDPEVEAIYVSLPNAMHREWTIRCAEAGKHVLCEKPVAQRAAAAQDMADACRKAGVLLMEAFMYRHHPQQQRVQALLAAGVIGEPRLIRASFCFYLRTPGDNIRVNRSLEGGALMDVGCYAVDVARFVFAAEPIEVMAMQHVPKQYGVDMTFTALLRFPGERLAVLDASFAVGSGGSYEVSGPYGSIRLDRAFTPGDADVVVQVSAAGRESEAVAGTNQYAREIDHFVRSVRAGRLLAPAEDGVANTRVIEALYRSAADGRAVAVGE
jgi:D-xylose 1-dehydrogenase (NADP+, D-xylono-1,5-lactone-forming)